MAPGDFLWSYYGQKWHTHTHTHTHIYFSSFILLSIRDSGAFCLFGHESVSHGGCFVSLGLTMKTNRSSSQPGKLISRRQTLGRLQKWEGSSLQQYNLMEVILTHLMESEGLSQAPSRYLVSVTSKVALGDPRDMMCAGRLL